MHPEAHSEDPSVFQRTLLTESLRKIFDKNCVKGNPLTTEDFEVILEKIKELGDIGYFSTPGFKTPGPYSPNRSDDPRSDEELMEAWGTDMKVEGNVESIIKSLLGHIKDTKKAPEHFFDDLYKLIGEQLEKEDLNGSKMLMDLVQEDIYPSSVNVFKDVCLKLLRRGDINSYLSFASGFNYSLKPAEAEVISLDELNSIADELDAKGKDTGYFRDCIGKLKLKRESKI